MPTDFDRWLSEQFARDRPFTALIVLLHVAEPHVTPVCSSYVNVIGDEIDWDEMTVLLQGSGIGMGRGRVLRRDRRRRRCPHERRGQPSAQGSDPGDRGGSAAPEPWPAVRPARPPAAGRRDAAFMSAAPCCRCARRGRARARPRCWRRWARSRRSRIWISTRSAWRGCGGRVARGSGGRSRRRRQAFAPMRPTSSKAAGARRFPAFSITGGACALDCDHCQAKILEPMIPATRPEVLEREVRTRAAAGDLAGFLLSGGSNRRNEVPFERFLPTIARLKADLPHLRIAAHTGLVDRSRAERLAEAGVEVAMLDVIGAEETIREVYHLDRPVADFEAALAALVATPLRVVPHVVIGLHYGRVLGEFQRARDHRPAPRRCLHPGRGHAGVHAAGAISGRGPARGRGRLPRRARAAAASVAFCSAARVRPARRVA